MNAKTTTISILTIESELLKLAPKNAKFVDQNPDLDHDDVYKKMINKMFIEIIKIFELTKYTKSNIIYIKKITNEALIKNIITHSYWECLNDIYVSEIDKHDIIITDHDMFDYGLTNVLSDVKYPILFIAIG